MWSRDAAEVKHLHSPLSNRDVHSSNQQILLKPSRDICQRIKRGAESEDVEETLRCSQVSWTIHTIISWRWIYFLWSHFSFYFIWSYLLFKVCATFLLHTLFIIVSSWSVVIRRVESKINFSHRVFKGPRCKRLTCINNIYISDSWVNCSMMWKKGTSSSLSLDCGFICEGLRSYFPWQSKGGDLHHVLGA